jgi:Mn2+/Fe2+ NRAMP family transporter
MFWLWAAWGMIVFGSITLILFVSWRHIYEGIGQKVYRVIVALMIIAMWVSLTYLLFIHAASLPK